MSVELTVDLRSLEDLRRRLSRVEGTTRDRIARDALMAGAQPVLAEAQRLAPVGSTGKGRASLEAGVNEDETMRGRPTVSIGPSAGTRAPRKEGFYLLFVERGTMPRFASSLFDAWRGQVTPQPFLRPALDSQGHLAVEIVRRELWRGLENAAR